MTKAIDGYEIQVGDIISVKNFLGEKRYKVHRVTKNYALIKYNDIAEGKFPRLYKSFGFSVRPRQKWDNSEYNVYIKE